MDDVVVDCPICGEPTDHAVLKATANNLTLQCRECGDTRSQAPPRQRVKTLKMVISAGPKAYPESLEIDPDDEISTGDEFEFNGHRMMVTGLELFEGKGDKAAGKDIKVLHAKLFDTVVLKLSVNEDDKTRSARLEVDPDEPYTVGQVIAVEREKWVVKTMKSDMNRTLHKGTLPARNIVRLFCDVAPHWVKEGKILGTRPRGAPPQRKGQAPKSRVKGPRSGAGKRR